MEEIKFTFPLTENAHIEIQVRHIVSAEKILYDASADVFLNQKGRYTRLNDERCSTNFYEQCASLHNVCRGLLRGKYMLDEQVIPDIGYVYNESCYRALASDYQDLEAKALFERISKHELWIVMGVANNMQAWAYSNTAGQVFFLVAPTYPFIIEDRQYLPFNEWIKTYAPFFKHIVSHDTIKQWMQQAETLLMLVEKNSKPYPKKKKHITPYQYRSNKKQRE